MTTKDSAGDKLVASIRKTKSAVATSSAPGNKKVVKKTAQSAKEKVVLAETEELTSSRKARLIDLFQSVVESGLIERVMCQ